MQPPLSPALHWSSTVAGWQASVVGSMDSCRLRDRPAYGGARAVRQVLVEGFPDTEVSIGIIWIHMLDSDSVEAAREAARIIDDVRVRQFHDPERRAGKAIAASLGGQGQIAWDIYLFYASGSEWGARPPVPEAWVHQLSADWADRTRFHWEEYLPRRLEEIMSRLSGAQRFG
jgi:hypothetical protein